MTFQLFSGDSVVCSCGCQAMLAHKHQHPHDDDDAPVQSSQGCCKRSRAVRERGGDETAVCAGRAGPASLECGIVPAHYHDVCNKPLLLLASHASI